ncbi:hypothetical protein Nwat_0378 [Nitrosococcus watsonii C-113]|uniref:Uncharacterized protein n=1 Tax=Nitrosococcus watsoni (strain C-113) TaxID=105559 RepID=D8K9Q9_NITWC|nr:hypothetical protein Nwat_0378 [Nitrosococcus watsonii C-113]
MVSDGISYCGPYCWYTWFWRKRGRGGADRQVFVFLIFNSFFNLPCCRAETPDVIIRYFP